MVVLMEFKWSYSKIYCCSRKGSFSYENCSFYALYNHMAQYNIRRRRVRYSFLKQFSLPSMLRCWHASSVFSGVNWVGPSPSEASLAYNRGWQIEVGSWYGFMVKPLLFAYFKIEFYGSPLPIPDGDNLLERLTWHYTGTGQ